MASLPPDEAWWERFFFEREKAVEQLMAREAEVGIDQALDEMEERIMAEAAARDALSQDDEDDEPPFDAAQACEDFEKALEDGEIDFDEEERVPDWASGSEELNLDMRAFTHAIIKADGPDDAVNAAMKASAHVAGAHGIGYHDDSLCGNIVKLRWADDQLRVAGLFLEGHSAAALLGPVGEALRGRLQARISRFRARAWWQRHK